MTEYIKRETLLNAVEKIDRLDKETNTKYEYDKEGYILLIQNAPTADVEEVRHGKWLDDIKEIMPLNGNILRKALVGYRCSECGRPEFNREPYCNCGAKMDGGVGSE